MKTLKAYAVVKKKRPRLNLLDIYDNKEIKVEKDEKIVRVLIKSVI